MHSRAGSAATRDELRTTEPAAKPQGISHEHTQLPRTDRQRPVKNNPALVQLLGLCPLLGVSNSAVNALVLARRPCWY